MNASQEVLNQACAIAGLDPDGARLLRLGSNAVYRLKAPIVARISRPGADLDHARRTVAVARWLESAAYPAVRLAEVDVDQPIVTDGYIATFWQALSDDGDQYASTPEIAEAVRKLHQLTPRKTCTSQSSTPSPTPNSASPPTPGSPPATAPSSPKPWPRCATPTTPSSSSSRRASSTATPASATSCSTATAIQNSST